MPEALARVTHLGVGAHQDDLEFMAFHGIAACFRHEGGRWFGGVTCTDGGGSARSGAYALYSDEAMRRVRIEEQRAAAAAGRYAAVIQLGHPSAEIKATGGGPLAADLAAILQAAQPEVLYTHSLADKHDTHIAVVAAVIAAIRSLPPDRRPARVLGCEVWRGLDWMCDAEKVALDVSGYDHLAAALNGIFDSQIAGGKRYDLATIGRRAANATYFESHATDRAEQVCFAMDLTPLALDEAADPCALVLGAVDRFREDVRHRVEAFFGKG